MSEPLIFNLEALKALAAVERQRVREAAEVISEHSAHQILNDIDCRIDDLSIANPPLGG